MRLTISFPFLLMLSACDPLSDNDDPLRAEIFEACMDMRAYQSVKAEKRANLCNCTYDTAIKGLSEDAQNAVRFYLLEQAGVEATSKDLVKNPPKMNVMVEASAAIGDAVKQCR